MSEKVMRAKVSLESVKQFQGREQLVLYPVCKTAGYDQDGLDEDNSYANFSPDGRFELTVSNPALIGKFKPGERFYVDFLRVDTTEQSAS